MRVLVCGGRDFDDQALLFTVLDKIHRKHGITLIIEGGARGADRLGRKWAEWYKVGCATFEADWVRYGARAGSVRNARMLREGKPDWIVACQGGAGTRDMVGKARQAGVKVFETWLHLDRIWS